MENNELRVILKNTHLKATKTRLEIYDYLRSNFTHPSIFDIYNDVRKKLPCISYATLYNVVNLLVEKGVVKELSTFENKKRYEGDTSNHIHLICTRCGKIEDAPTNYKDLKKLEKANGWEVNEAVVNLYGLCEECKNKN